jgi:hypothetical protein
MLNLSESRQRSLSHLIRIHWFVPARYCGLEWLTKVNYGPKMLRYITPHGLSLVQGVNRNIFI